MTQYKKSAMHEGQNKIARFIRLDQLLRTPGGVTLEEILRDPQIDDISKRTLQINLNELQEKYGAVFEEQKYRGKERLWRYKNPDFSFMKQTSTDVEIIRKAIENLSIFKGDPRYDMLRFYLMSIENGMSEVVSFMSFDNNIDVVGLDHVEDILDAITHRYPLKMTYEPFGKPKFEVRIHPYHLRQYNRRWFVFCRVEEREEVFNYPLDRIKSLVHLSKTFIDTDINFDEYFDDIVGVTNYKNNKLEEVLLKVDNKSIDYIRTKPIHQSQKELKERNTDKYSYIQLNVKVNTELKMLLFSYSDAIEVLKPKWLRNTFKKRIMKMSSFYKD